MMQLKSLDRKPMAYEIIPDIRSRSPIIVDVKGTVNVHLSASLNVAEAKEVAMSVLFAAALAELEGGLSKSRENERWIKKLS